MRYTYGMENELRTLTLSRQELAERQAYSRECLREYHTRLENSLAALHDKELAELDVKILDLAKAEFAERQKARRLGL